MRLIDYVIACAGTIAVFVVAMIIVITVWERKQKGNIES